MNKKRLSRVRDLIANVLTDKQFDMGSYGDTSELRKHKCGSAGCIGGWVCALYPPVGEDLDMLWHSDVATTALDLNEQQADYLFCGSLSSVVLGPLTRQDAVKAIDTLIETGMPVWPDNVMRALNESY